MTRITTDKRLAQVDRLLRWIVDNTDGYTTSNIDSLLGDTLRSQVIPGPTFRRDVGSRVTVTCAIVRDDPWSPDLRELVSTVVWRSRYTARIDAGDSRRVALDAAARASHTFLHEFDKAQAVPQPKETS